MSGLLSLSSARKSFRLGSHYMRSGSQQVSNASLFTVSRAYQVQIVAWIRTWNRAKDAQDSPAVRSAAAPEMCGKPAYNWHKCEPSHKSVLFMYHMYNLHKHLQLDYRNQTKTMHSIWQCLWKEPPTPGSPTLYAHFISTPTPRFSAASNLSYHFWVWKSMKPPPL